MELNHDVPRIRLLNVNPLVGILENFTDAQTSAAITEFASQKLKVATVHINGESVVKPNVRTGQLSWAKHGELPALDEMRARIARILRIDAAYCEQIQLVKYTSSEQYVPHFDSFHFAADKYPANIRNQGQRFFTALLYLTQNYTGGSTSFPKLGLQIRPRLGRLLIWSNTILGGSQPHPNSLHGGDPVEDGEKWIATFWFRRPPIPDPVLLTAEPV